MSVQNESGRSAGLSNQVQVPSAPTLPPPEHFHAEVKRDGVLLSWECPPAMSILDRIAYKLRIYRREQGKQTDTKVSDANLTTCSQTQPVSQSPEFLDQTFEWEKHYDYCATLVTVVSAPGKPEIEVEGDDTPSSRFSPTIFFLQPCPPACRRFSQVLARRHSLIWCGLPTPKPTLPDTTSSVMRRANQPVKLNSEPVKAPAYRDTKVQSGKKYFYSVSAVDERNNESAKSEEASEQVP